MSSEVEWPDAVIGEAWHEYRYPQAAIDPPTDRFMRAARVFQASSRAAVAAELDRLAAELDQRGEARDAVADDDCEEVSCHTIAAVGTWFRAAAALRVRASELRGEGKGGDG